MVTIATGITTLPESSNIAAITDDSAFPCKITWFFHKKGKIHVHVDVITLLHVHVCIIVSK